MPKENQYIRVNNTFEVPTELIGMAIDVLTTEQLGILFKSIFHWQHYEKIPEGIDDIVKFALIILVTEFKKEDKSKKRGKHSHLWKGGISSKNALIRNSAEYSDWRGSVFIRDNYTCQSCGAYGVALNAHHIKKFSEYPDLRLDINNGITLCVECHKDIHYKNSRIK